MRYAVLFAFCLSGAAALIYEVTWTRALSLILGSTTYALSTMLATFMAGLAIGGLIGGRVADRGTNLLMLFGLAELGIGIFGLITIPLINAMPPLFFLIYKSFHLSPSVYLMFQFLLCAAVMIIPTTLMGATFPIVSKRVTEKMEVMGRGVGNAYSFNTFGAIVGSIAAGFILIPTVGVKTATIIAAGLNTAVALVMIGMSRARMKGMLVALVLVSFAAPLVIALISQEEEWPMTFHVARRVQDYNKYIADKKRDVILFDREYREGRVKLWKNSKGFLIVQVGGKIEGTDASDLSHTVLLSYLPIAMHQDPQSFLLIGLGTGFTLYAAKEHMSDIHVVEINQGVVDAQREFGLTGLLDNVAVTVDDARHYLYLIDRRYDVISSGPSYPTEASSANLFTKDFYEMAAKRLNTGGVYCQSLPYYLLSNDDVTMMLRTFSSVFPHVYLWRVEKSLDLIMVGSKTPFALDTGKIQEGIQKMNRRNLPLHYTISRTPEQVTEIVEKRTDIPVNTDDTPYLEFSVARNAITGVH